MNRIARHASTLVLALFLSTAAATQDKLSPIGALQATVAMGELEAMAPNISHDAVGAMAVGTKTKEKLESLIDKALAAAKRKPDLLKATKEYYVAALSYFGALGSTDRIQQANEERLKTVLDEKETALELELKLAK